MAQDFKRAFRMYTVYKIWIFLSSKNFIKPARKPQAFKPGDEWRPERSVGNPAKPGSPKETLDFSPGSFISLPHNNRIYENDWGYRSNSMGKDGQRIGHYSIPIDDWASRL